MNKKVRKKPTIREITNVVIELNNRVNNLTKFLGELEKAFSLYVEMNKDDKKFTKFIDKKVKEWKTKENEAKGNGVSNKPNLQGDTDGEKSGAEGVRQEAG